MAEPLSSSFSSSTPGVSRCLASESSPGFRVVSKNVGWTGKSSDSGKTQNGSEKTSSESETILSVYWKRGKLGAAYFTTHESEIHLLDDVVDCHPDFKNLKCLMNQVEYSQVITCTNLAESFTKTLKTLVYGDEDGGCDVGASDVTNRKLLFMPGKKQDFSYDSCKRLILNQRFSFEPKFSNEEDHLLFINTHIDLRKESAVMSLGILLKYLEKYIPRSSLGRDALRIAMLHQINLENAVSIDEASYKALQIFHVLHHPSAFKMADARSGREGLSIFGIFNRCKSRIGAKRMRQIFTNPIKDLRELNSRLDAVEFCYQSKHEHVVKSIGDCIKKVESVTGILGSIYRSRSNMNHWKSLYSSLYNATLIGQICEKYSTHSRLFQKLKAAQNLKTSNDLQNEDVSYVFDSNGLLGSFHGSPGIIQDGSVSVSLPGPEVAQSITKKIHEVTHYINHLIDFEESFSRNQFTVRVGIDSKLDRLRQTYAQVPDVLVKVAELELKDLPDFIEKCCVVYITELGYLLSVPVWTGEGKEASDYQLPNFDVKFVVNNYVYYKTPRCDELDNVLGDLLASMCGIESKIMVELMEFIHERVPDIVRVVNLIAELDCVIAMADIASENNYTRPVLTNERKLEIAKGRHPLQELCVNNFVPNDTSFTSRKGLIKILTGPNASGKSVYLKQIAVIAFLAHIGSFVPAEKAVINVLDHIHSRIHPEESISTRMSSFILDLKQMSHAIYNSTPSSLIIIDEFGKGTTEIDGLALLAASLIHFAERGDNCPFVLVSTHFHKLPKLLPETPLIHLQYMDYLVQDDEIIYLHRIKDGASVSSLSHLAAKSAGLSERSLKRFIEISKLDDEPIKCNMNLGITKTMLEEVKHMQALMDGYDRDLNKE